MIPDNYIPPIRFGLYDQPELTEIPDFCHEAEREAECRRREENIRWLEQNAGFKPFGDVW